MKKKNLCGSPQITYINDPSSTSNTFYTKGCPVPIKNSVRCDSNVGCIQTVNSECIIYNGKDFPIVNIIRGQNLNSTIEYLVNAINTASTQADWAETNPNSNSFIKNKPDLSIYYLASNPAGYIDASYVTWLNVSGKPNFAQVAFSGDYNDLINIPPVVVPDLQSVTDVGFVTTNPIFSVDSGSGTTITVQNNAGTNPASVRMVSQPDTSSLQFQAPGQMWIDRNAIGSNPNDLVFTTSLGSVVTNVMYANGRMSGSNAVDPNDFVVLSQVSSLITNIYNSNGTLTGDRTVDGGNNNFVILNTDQLSLNANTNLVLENTTTGDQIVMDSTLLSIASFNDISINAVGNLQLVGSGGIDVVSPISFGSTAKGISAVSPDEFVILSQLSSYVPTSRTLTINGTAFNLTANRSWTIPTIYTSNGSLASNRTISGGNTFQIRFDDMVSFTTTTAGGSELGISDTIFGAFVPGSTLTMDNSLFNLSTEGLLQISALGGVEIADTTTFFQPTFGLPGTDPNHYIVLSQLDTEAIRNQTTEQSPANFNISGNGTIAGTTTTPTLISPAGTDLNINTPAAQMMSFNIGSTDIMHITTDGAAIGGIIPNSARSAPLEVAGNIWSEDAFILGLSGSSTPRSEYGLSGANDAFVRMMNTGNLEFLTNASTVIARVNGTTENFEVINQIKISGGTPGIGKVLMDSDGTGLGEWTTIGGGSGTVTSVGLTSSDITVGGTSPITTSGTYTLTLPNVNSNIGTFNNVTVNAKGQVTAASNVSYLTTETDPVVSARTLTLTQGTGITVTNSGVAQSLGASRSWTITNSAPDQTVVLSNGTGISVTGTYPNFTITNTSPNTNQSLDQVLTVGNSSSQEIIVGQITSPSLNSGGPVSLNLGTDGNDYVTIDTSGEVTLTDKIITPEIQVTGGTPGVGKVLTDIDGSGNASWQLPSSTSGPLMWDLTAINTGTGPHTIQPTDVVVRYQPSSSGYTTNLPAVATSVDRVLILRNQSASETVTLSLTVQTLTGSTTTLATQSSMMIISDGTNWIQLF